MDLFELVGRIAIQGGDTAQSTIRSVTGIAENSGSKIGNAMKSVAAAIGLGFGTAKIIGFGKDVMMTTATFSDSMKKVQSLSGASGTELEKLTDTAIDFGSKTAWTSSQVADAMGYMALAGFDTNQIMAALPGTLSLASAAGTDLGRTSDILTDALTAFGYEAKDAILFSNVLATTQAKSNTTVDALGEAFKYAGTQAGTYGYSVEDVSTALGLMANAGVKGSMAGTAFSSIVSRLGTNTRGARDAIEALGIEFFNADGTARPLGDVLMELCDATADMTVEQKANIAKQIAGQEAMKGLLAILNQGSGAYKKLNDTLKSCDGSASDMASTMESGIGGALRTMQSAWEGFKIRLGQKFEAPLTDLLQKLAKFVTGTLIPAMNRFFDTLPLISQKMKELGAEIANTHAFNILKDLFNAVADIVRNVVIPALGEFIANLPQIVSTLNDIIGTLERFQPLIEVIVGSLIGLKAGLMIQGAVQAFQNAQVALALFKMQAEGATIAQGILNGELTLGEAIVALFTGEVTLAELASGAWAKAQAALNAVMAANPIALVVMGIAALIAIFIAAYRHSETFRNFVDGLWAKIKEVGGKFLDWCKTVPDKVKSFFNSAVEFFSGIPDKVKGIVDKIKDFFSTAWDNIKTGVTNAFDSIKNTIVNVFDGIKNFFSTTLDNIKTSVSESFDHVKNSVTNAFENIKTSVSNGITAVKDFFINGVNTIKTEVPIILNAIVNFFKELPYNIGVAIGTVIGTLASWAVNMYNTVITEVPKIIDSVVTFFTELPGKIQTAISTAITHITAWAIDMYNAAVTGISNVITSVVAFFTALPGKIQSAISSAITHITEWATSIYNTAVTGISNMITTVVTYLTALPGKIQNAIKSAITKVTAWALSVKTAAVTGIKNTVNTVTTTAKELPGKIYNAIIGAVTKVTAWATSVKTSAVNGINNMVNNVTSTAKALPGKIYNAIVGAIARVSAWATNMVTTAKNGMVNVANTIINTLSQIPGKVLTIGKNIVTGIWNGISGAGSWLRTQISNFASGIISGFTSAFKINSPSRVMRDKVGVFIAQGIGVGITEDDSSEKSIKNKVASIMDIANNSMSDMSIGANINDIVTESPVSKYQVRFDAQFNALNDGFERLLNLVGQYLPDIAENSNKEIRIDGSSMAAGMSRYMDNQLGKLAIAKGRGNV